jgi:hypothetical protein
MFSPSESSRQSRPKMAPTTADTGQELARRLGEFEQLTAELACRRSPHHRTLEVTVA